MALRQWVAVVAATAGLVVAGCASRSPAGGGGVSPDPTASTLNRLFGVHWVLIEVRSPTGRFDVPAKLGSSIEVTRQFRVDGGDYCSGFRAVGHPSERGFTVSSVGSSGFGCSRGGVGAKSRKAVQAVLTSGPTVDFVAGELRLSTPKYQLTFRDGGKPDPATLEPSGSPSPPGSSP